MLKYFTISNLKVIKFIQDLFVVSFLVLLISSCNNNTKVNEQFQNIENSKIQPLGIFVSYPMEGTIFPLKFRLLNFYGRTL